MQEQVSNGSPQRNGEAAASFSELVRAHHRWAEELHGPKRVISKEAEQAYRRKLTEFEQQTGEIFDAYWCTRDASAVAMTVKKPPAAGSPRRWRRWPRPSEREAEDIRLHRVTDWVTHDMGEIADLLHHCDILAIKVSTGLHGTPRRVAMQWIFAVQGHLLGFIERMKDQPSDPARLQQFARRQEKELLQIDDYYQHVGQKAARLTYVEGMLLGLIPLALLGAAASGLFALFHALDLDGWTREFFACYAAGGFGAVVSVLSRMAEKRGKFVIDHEIDDRGLRHLGSYRPLVGAVSGVVVYLLAQTALLQIENDTKTLQFYVVAAFLAGFSERWTQVILGGAEQTSGRSLEAQERPADGTSS